MSHSRHDDMRSHHSKSSKHLQSDRSSDRSIHRSSTSHTSHGASSRSYSNYGTSHQSNRSRSNSTSNRYSDNKNHTSYVRDLGTPSSFNEQTRHFNPNNNYNHHVDRKRHSTTFHTTTDSPPIKRPHLPPVSYSTLIKLLDKSSDEILTGMLDPNFQLERFLNDKRMQQRYDWTNSMTILLEKITECHESHERILTIFEQLPNTLYLEGVYDEIEKTDSNTNQLRFEFIRLFLKIANKFLTMIPHSSNCLKKFSNEFEDTKQILDGVLERVKQIEKQRQEPLNTTTIQTNIVQPFGDYRQLPVVPNIVEILADQRTYLRKNIINGIYENAEQYLDIHFRLLREDFIGPLRDGIQEYLSKNFKKNFNVRIYENVYLKGSRLTVRNELVYDFVLDRKLVSKIFWSNSRRLIYGNLLVLTYDNFQSCAFVTVQDRSQIERNFTVSVRKLENLNNNTQVEINLDDIDSSRSLIMLETMTYFEAYRPVLNALQMIPTDDRFPLAPFILKLQNELTPPDYITSTTTYDFTPLLVDPDSDVQTKLTIVYKILSDDPAQKRATKFQIKYEQSNQTKEKYKKVSILNKDQWPTSEQLHLNPKQREGLILALTNKVALIQGPPGTGKTYLGVRITEMLLHNRSVWCPVDQQSTPILMICQTNHALDQFLELIIKRLNIDDGIIRVGRRCENSTVQPFSLFNARQRAQENHSIPSNIFFRKFEIFNEKKNAEQELKSNQNKSEMSRINILPPSLFLDASIIDHRHYTSLLKQYNGDCTDKALLKWLDISDEYEQISDDSVYKEKLTTSVPSMKINDNIEENIEDNQDKISENDLNEEDEEEQRRRNEIDMEEYESDFSSSTVQKSETVILNIENKGCLSNEKNDNKEKSQTVRNDRNDNLRTIKYIIQNPTTLTDETVKQINDDVWQLPMLERYDLYRYWLLKYQQYLHDSSHYARQEYNQAVSDLTEYYREVDFRILKDAIIIAMTTTGAAKYHQVLEKLQSKIVIVEEAAAIFEAHIITALSTKCEHLILIGDHVQLRPNPSVYHLGTKYQIDVSLFERLIKNNFPNVRLNIQHRMRPEISRLMKHFYDDLNNHESVENDRVPIRGINSNIFFINHNHPETNIDDGRSKRNEFEANYIIELAQYLIKQGYKSKQITILVMYLGQKQFISKQAKQIRLLEGVRIMVTDNYQGEENDIILLSLVRSNSEKKIGFLEIHNRICVALSRARCGLFVIGNMDLLAEVNDIWKKIVTSLTETNHIGKGLNLSCRQHPEPKFLADKPESFAQRPEGGCRKRCDTRLKCGHQCELTCHNYDPEHNYVICYKNCDEQLSCGHLCRKECHIKIPDQHEQCRVSVEKTIPKCGHQILFPCCATPTISDCKNKSLIRLPCNHSVEVPCRIISSPDELARFYCPKPCNTMLDCQHKCSGKCGDCRGGKLHVACDEKCDRELICSHVCKAPCASNCPPCSRRCETRCVHSRCEKTCGEPCTPCKEPCTYKCKHLRCTRLCSEPCDRGPCNKPCNKKLQCGHDCIGMCGEPCPWQCRICDEDIVQEILWGTEDEPNARFVFLPDCNHIIEVTGLDQYINNYLNNSNDDKRAIRFPECPRCRRKIYRCIRYMTISNNVYGLITQIKKKILGNLTKQEINDRRKQLIIEYEELPKNLKEINFNKSMKDYFSFLHRENNFFTDDMFNLLKNIIEFLYQIDKLLADGRIKLKHYKCNSLVILPLNYILRYLFQQRHYRNFAKQQLKDIQAEFQRIRRVIFIETFISSLERILNDDEKQGIDMMRDLTTKSGAFTNEDRQKFDDLVKQYDYLNNLPGLGINEQERKAIVSALNMKQGHWYVCPNGHPYVITECGGAMQESQCPECGEQIGGQSHQLLESNHHFGLMDQSHHSAWSNEANLNGPH